MKIVHVLGWYFPESTGGTEVYVAALCRRLRDAGHETLVAAPDAARLAAGSYEHEGTPVFRYPIPPRPTRDEAQGAVPVRGASALEEFFARHLPNVVHFHSGGLGAGPFAQRAAVAAGARTFFTAHESRLGHLCQRGDLLRFGEALCDGLCEPVKCADCALHQRGMLRPLSSLLAAIPAPLSRAAQRLPSRIGTALSMRALIAANQERQRELVATVERFVVLTQAALEIAARNGAPRHKLALNRLGTDHARAAKPTVPTRPPITVGYLGRFDRVKGVAVLAAAVARLPASVPLRVELRGPLRTDAERAVVAEVRALLRGDPRVVFAPAVDPREVPAVLAGYDVLCCPSLCLEGGPTVALEAYGAGTPVIGSRIGGLAEIVDDPWGALVPPGDAVALAALLRRIAEQPAATIDCWRRGLPIPRTMDDVARDYLALYAA